MHRLKDYLSATQKIIEGYQGGEPLSGHLKKYFTLYKRYGSKDRKKIAALCYNFYRLGGTLTDVPMDEKILIGTFLGETTSNECLHFFKPHWNAVIHEPVDKKLELISLQLDFSQIFPYLNELSDGMDPAAFCKSFLIQPDLFLRVRIKKKILFKKIEKLNVPYRLIGEDSIALPNGSKVEDVLDLDKEVVVQDLSSQQVLNFFKNEEVLRPINHLRHFEVTKNGYVHNAWDCCAGSGGKSILLYDILKRKVEITASDIRLNILINLHKRFRRVPIRKYNYFVADLCSGKLPIDSPVFNIIICDAPCTGSGTWGRTPEHLAFFNAKFIAPYAEKQKRMVGHAAPFLHKEGYFVYITCSVFKQENEGVVEFIKKELKFQLLQMELIKGYDKKADTMFVAVFKK